MGMTITCNISADRIQAYMRRVYETLQEQIIIQLQYLGQECVSRIRGRGQCESWIDRTGNLRSSIGSAVYENGKKKLSTAFESVFGGQEGSEAGKRMIDALAKEFSQTYAMVVVAGMDYASYVENMNGKDVLASTRLWAESVIGERIEDALHNAEEIIKKIEL